MRPKAIVLMIGTNNTGDRLEDPALTVAGIRKNLDEIWARSLEAPLTSLMTPDGATLPTP